MDFYNEGLCVKFLYGPRLSKVGVPQSIIDDHLPLVGALLDLDESGRLADLGHITEVAAHLMSFPPDRQGVVGTGKKLWRLATDAGFRQDTLLQYSRVKGEYAKARQSVRDTLRQDYFTGVKGAVTILERNK